MQTRLLREDLVIQACLAAYSAVRHEGRFASGALDYILRRAKHLHSHERRAVAERVFGLLRRKRLVEFLAEQAIPDFCRLTESRQDLLHLAITRVLEGEKPHQVLQHFGLSAKDAQWLCQLQVHQAKLSRLSREHRFAIEASVPDFLASKLLAELSGEEEAYISALRTRAPLTIRANTLSLTREELAIQLSKEKVQTRPTLLSPYGLLLDTHVNAFSLKAFKAGFFEVQDEGSQLLGMLVDAPPRKVVDACAGTGGKTLQLAAQMKNRGELFAFDNDARRLERLKLRRRRAGVQNVRVHAMPTAAQANMVLEKLSGVAERVLVDAPCSGTGAFRRKPDMRYRLTKVLLDAHVERQNMLISYYAKLVKPNGRLVYGTCSILSEENENIVHNFIEHHPDFELISPTPWLGDTLAMKTTRDGMLRLFPHRHGTDGFFGAVLRRKHV